MTRKRKENQELREIIMMKTSPTAKTWRGKTLLSARDAEPCDIQETFAPVIVGADVKALYPSLSDLESALICYKAVIETKVTFTNINYRLATKYIAICMTDDEQKVSPLRNILQRRTE